jgi:hypothetical protein
MPQSIPGRNKSCTTTYPGENQRPTARSIDQHRDNWRVDDGTYDDSYEESWHRKPHRRFIPYYEGRHFEDNASIPYGYQPSSPYRSSLYVAPRRQCVSLKDAFEDVSTFKDAFRREFNKVSYFVFLWIKIRLKPTPSMSC